MSDKEEGALTCKVVLIGESGVGKTSIITRYITNEFKSQMMATSGANYISKYIILEDENQSIKFDIWDTAGQEKFRSLGKNFYRDAYIILMVFDITRQETFDNLKKIWYPEITQNGVEKPLLAVVGNKSDEYEKDNTVNEEEARQFANEIKCIFQLVSAKNGDNVQNLFNVLLDTFFELKFPDKIKDNVRRRKSHQLIDNNNNTNPKKKKCC